MGGNALATKTRRLDKEEFEEIEAIVCYKLKKYYSRVAPIQAYFNKETFGDLDIIVSTPRPKQLSWILKQEFQTKEIVINGGVVSFEFRDFQIDLIQTHFYLVPNAEVYFSYNDLGMLMGMVAKRFNCKYGEKGLFYVTEYNGKKKEIFLTKDIPTIFDFLGFDFNRYKKGFYTLYEIYNFVIDSKFFDIKRFLQQDGWNHYKRKRNAKRSTWVGFQKYLRYYEIDKETPLTRNKCNERIDSFFPGILEQEQEFIIREKLKQRVKQKFNGERIGNLTGLKGKELGDFIASFKKRFTPFEDFIINNSLEKIDNEIIDFFYKKQLYEELENDLPIDEKILEMAKLFVKLFPLEYPIPIISLDPDGMVVFEWYQTPHRLFSLSLDSKGIMYYATLLDGYQNHGTSKLQEEIPAEILKFIDNVNHF